MSGLSIGVLGSNGFVGSNVCVGLQAIPVPRSSSSSHFDVLVNCAGTSKRYLAERDPDADWNSCREILKLIDDLKFDRLVHISSIDAQYCKGIYGKHKLIMDRVLLAKHPTIVIRLAGLVGKGLKKNAVFDIANDRKVWATADSVFNYINIACLAPLIDTCIDRWDVNPIINFAADGNITLERVCQLLHKSPQFGEEKEVYGDIDIEHLKDLMSVGTSEDYVRSFAQEIT